MFPVDYNPCGIWYGGLGLSTVVSDLSLSLAYDLAQSPLETGFDSLDKERQEIGLWDSRSWVKGVEWGLSASCGLSESTPDFGALVQLQLW